MRICYTISGILLIPPIINFAVAAPVLVQEKLQARVNEDAMDMLGKRAGELDGLWAEFFGDSEGHLPQIPEELPAEHPPLTLPKSEPAEGPIDVEQPVPIPGEPPLVPSPDRAPPSLGYEGNNKMWSDPIKSKFPVKQEESSGAGPSSSSLPPGAAHGWMDVKPPLLPIKEEPVPVPSQVPAPSRPGDLGEASNELVLYGHHFSDGPIAARPLASWPSGPYRGSTDVKPPLLPIKGEPVPLSSQVPAPPGPGEPGEELNKLWLDLYGHDFSDEPIPARPVASHPLGPSHGWTDVEQSLPPTHKVPVPVSSQVHPLPRPGGLGEEWNKMWRDLIDRHFPAKPAKSSAARPSSSSQPLGPVASGGRTNVKQSPPSIHKEPALMSSQVPAPPRPGGLGEEWTKMWRDLIDRHFPAKPAETSAAGPSSSSQPLGPVANSGQTDVKQSLLPIHKEPVLVFSQVPAPPRPGGLGEEWNKMWRKLIETSFPAQLEKSSATHPLSSTQPSGPPGGTTDVKPPLPPIHEHPVSVSSPDHAPPNSGSSTESGYELMKGDVPHWPSGPVSSTMSSALHGLMGAHALPNPGPFTGWNHEMMDVSQSIPVSSIKHDLQPIDGESSSGKRIKTDKERRERVKV